jgi:hypothetical protein
MGQSATKLVEFNDFCAGFRSLRSRISQLETLKLFDIPERQFTEVATSVWKIIHDLRVGIAETKIVVGSKALHHVLPELVTPIDREYTLRFFYRHKTLNHPEEVVFKETFEQFRKIAVQSRTDIERELRSGMDAGAPKPMNTSTTKVIDNAIVGYVRFRL